MKGQIRTPLKAQGGFTLIELIAVIVILGILSAVAVPRFVNLQDAARQAAAEGVAGALASGSALNYADALTVQAGLSSSTLVDTSGGCDSAPVETLADADLTDYTIQSGSFTGTTLGETITCTIDHDTSSASATFALQYVDPAAL